MSEREIALGANRPNPKHGALVVAAVAVVLVGGGLIAGTGGGDDEQVSPTPSTTVARPSTTEGRPTRTTVNRTTTSSIAPTYTAASIPELGGLPLYAIVNSQIIRIDTATGQSVVLGEGVRGVDQGSSLIARAGGVVVWGDEARFFPDDGSAPVSLGYGEVFPAADPTLVWVRDYRSGTESQIQLKRVATGQEVANVSLPAFSFPMGDDGTGHLLVRGDAGGAFTIDPATGVATRLSDTVVVAATATHLLLIRCDDALVCGSELVDRSNGEVTFLPAVITSAYGAYSLDPTHTRVAFLEYGERGPELRIVELSTGADEIRLNVADEYYSGYLAPAWWTPDGQHLVTAIDSSIGVWTTGSSEPARYPITTGATSYDAIVTASVLGF